jgi:hypothetical protein
LVDLSITEGLYEAYRNIKMDYMANSTLTSVEVDTSYYDFFAPIVRVAVLNNTCKELGIEPIHRYSVPHHLKTKADIRKFLLVLKHGFEEWRSMKMIVLGNGGIGKTTLLHGLKEILGKETLHKEILGKSFLPGI